MTARLGLLAAIVLAACAGGDPTPTPTASATPSSPSPSATPSASPSPTATVPPSPTATPAPAAWTQREVSGGPAAREDHTWTVDPAGEIAYLHGGRDGGSVYGDLWAYELATDTWRQLTPSGPVPAARFGHEAVWMDGVGLVIVFGQVGSTFFNDLWAYDPDANAWRRLPSTGAVPVARYGSCAAVGPDGRLWVSHGFTADGTRFADTLAWEASTGAWTDETPPGDRPVNRCLHGCWWTDDGSLTLYAGQTTGVTALGDLWRYDAGERPGTATWARLAGSLPTERNLYARARVDGATLVFGGQANDGRYIGGLWSFPDGADGAMAVETVGAQPPGRAGAELVVDAARGRLLLMGGKGDGGALGDLWELPLP